MIPAGPDSANGRASASRPGGRGFDPWPRHQNSLLVKRQIDNPSPGAVTGGN